MQTITEKTVFIIEREKEEHLPMKKFKVWQRYLLFILISGVFLITGCGGGGNGSQIECLTSTTPTPNISTAPTVIFTDPANGDINVAINKKISATFSEDMDSSTLTDTTFTVAGVTGTVDYDPITRIAIFTPGSNLASNTTYTATISTAARSLAGIAMAADYTWSFTTGTTLDNTPPTVTFTDPDNGDIDVVLNKRIAATFSEAMDPSTLTNGTTFTLTGPGGPVSGTVTYVGLVATFRPGSNLAIDTTYTATITTAARDLAGNPMAADYTWSFTTGVTLDNTAPTVIFTDPADGDINVALNKKIAATFSESMDPSTLINPTTFTLAGPGVTPVSGTVSYVGLIATFIPESNLLPNTTYTATITTAATDLAGNGLAGNYIWSFTTGATLDTTPPTVILTDPLNGATNVVRSKKITATFSENMDPSTMTNTTFSVAGVIGTVLYDPITRIATFTPGSYLASDTTYTATITTAARDLAGNAMVANYIWSFTTGKVPPPLGAAERFGAFGGGAGITNEGILTEINNGDIGTTGVSTVITGFHDSVGDIYTETTLNIGNVTGRIYTAPPPPGGAGVGGTAATFAIAQAGAADALIAFNYLAGLPPGSNPGANLGGLTLAPGTYTAPAGSFLLTGSDLTLDGQGNPDAVWVFQMTSSLTVGAPANPRSIILINGAQAKNVFWQVGSAATINGAGGGTMVGTIISSAGIEISTTGNNLPSQIVTINGRVLALNASVTMTNTVINVPAP